MTAYSGVWVPLVTPFKDGLFDRVSYRRLIEHYLEQGIAGLFPLGTTGEAPTLDEDEVDAIVGETLQVVAGRVPVLVGIGGNATAKVVKEIRRLERHRFAGIVSVCPYYNRPTQHGLLDHFRFVSEATDRPILIYNIPYRTGVNLANETLLALAERPNIVGVKDSCGNLAQSLDLLATRSAGFSILTGEDALFFTMLANGADGGILAAAHLATATFVTIARRMVANDHRGALQLWRPLAPLVARLFAEANPMPVKYCLWRQGLIASPECRSPLGSIGKSLAAELDRLLPAVVAVRERPLQIAATR